MVTTTIPALTFALTLSLLCGALYHFIRGGSGWYLMLYFLLSALGFAAGQGLCLWRGWIMLRFGMLDVGFGILGSILFLIIGEWLSKIEVKKDDESGV
jgi:hypothetical protein